MALPVEPLQFPGTGLIRTEDHHYSWCGGPLVPGITSVIKMLDKSGPLVGWAKRETAASAVRNLEMLHRLVSEGGPEAATKWLSAIPDYQRDTAADLGSKVHALAESIARKRPVEVDAEAAPFVESYLKWRTRNKPKETAAEFMVYSERFGYGGTGDVAAVIGDDLWGIDIKTGKGVYPEYALQLSALFNADWCGLAGDGRKYKVPPATRFGILHVRPEQTELVPFSVGPDEFRAFLACRELHRWTAERAPKVKGAK